MMRNQRTVWSMLAVSTLLTVMLLTTTLPALSNSLAQDNPTQQKQTIDAIVAQRFTQTAQAQQAASTQTAQSAAAAATATFQKSVDDAFNDALTATARPASAATSSPFQVDNLTVIAVDKLEALKLPGKAYLSPDGEWIAYVRAQELCIYSAAGEKQVCAATQRLDMNSVRWSPDSTRVAFTEDFFRTFNDPDIWVMDATSGKLTDLTDDGVLKFDIKPDAKNGDVDVAPRWSSDGKRLVFIRYLNPSSDRRAAIYTVDASGGTPQEQGATSLTGFPVYALAWSPDGKTIAYNSGRGNRADPINGLWVSDLDTSNSKQLLRYTMPTDTKNPRQVAKVAIPTDIEFSSDGRYLLVFDPFGLGQFGLRGDEFSSNRVVAVNGSGDSPVDADEVAHWATWSPSGLGLIYFVRSFKDQTRDGLYVVSKPGEKGRKIYDGAGSLMIPPGDSWRTSTWAANNTILIYSVKEQSCLLLHLGVK